jgi:hypothetical protein
MKQLEINQQTSFLNNNNIGNEHYRDIRMKNHYKKLE